MKTSFISRKGKQKEQNLFRQYFRTLFCLVCAFILFNLVFIQKPLSAQSLNTTPDYSNDWAFNPFNANSAWHRPIGTDAIYADDSDITNIVWQQAKVFKVEDNFPYGSPFGIADEASPEVTITHRTCPAWNTNPDGNRFPLTIKIPSRADFPVGWRRLSDCQDGNAIIFDRTTSEVHELYEYDRSDTNNITASLVRGPYYLDGLGHGSELNERVGLSAAGISLLGGAFRPWEVMKPGHRIGHAFQMSVPANDKACEWAKIDYHVLGKNIQWPAVSGDGFASNPANNLGPFAYGALLAIPPGPDCIVNGEVHDRGGPDLTKMGLSEPGLRVAQALRDYGVYLVDNAGGFNIRGVSTAEQLTGSVSTAVRNDLTKICRELRLVKNSVIGATARKRPTWGQEGFIGTPTWPAGGGEPLAPNTAIDFVSSSHDEISSPGITGENIRVYPNPAADRITVEFNKIPDRATIEVFTILGQVVKSRQLYDQRTQIDLPDAHDVFLIRVFTAQGSKAFKILSQAGG